MAVTNRDSNANLTKDEVFARLSEETIFRHYCRNFVKFGAKFKSEFRHDPVPSAVIFEGDTCLRYLDYGERTHSFDVFAYIMFKYRITFKESLVLIDRDFCLGLSGGTLSVASRAVAYVPRPVQKASLLIKSRDWKNSDVDFWKEFGISRDLAERAYIQPISHYWINGMRYHAPKHCYAYCEFYPRIKIYSPELTEGKWFSNTGKNDIQGYSLLPCSGEICALTSSLKDALSLHSAGIPSIALQSETLLPPEKLILHLKKKFSKIIVIYDNDFHKEPNTGQVMGNKIADKYELLNVCIDSKYLSKDPSDLVKNHGLETLKLINTGIEKEKR